MDTKELLSKVRKIEIKSKGLSTHIFSGEYHSAFKGRGMSFSEVREYQYGDDVRSIDWNVTARFNHPYIKIFEEERELTVILLVDVSGSSAFGTVNQMKQEMVTEICAVLSFSAINNNDKVGVIFFSDRIEKYIPPKKGRTHILRIIRELLDFTPAGTRTDLQGALIFFNNVIKKRSIAFILSDFMCMDYAGTLNIVKRRHDVVGVRVYDQRDSALPVMGLVQVRDAETGQVFWLDSSRKKIRQAFHSHYDGQHRYFQESFIRSGADRISIGTNESYVNSLIRFFRNREKKR